MLQRSIFLFILFVAVILKASRHESDIESATISDGGEVENFQVNTLPEYIVVWRPPDGGFLADVLQLMRENPSGCAFVIVSLTVLIIGIILVTGGCRS